MTTSRNRPWSDDVSKKLKEKILELARKCRRNGYTQPVNLTLTIPEVQELAKLAEDR